MPLGHTHCIAVSSRQPTLWFVFYLYILSHLLCCSPITARSLTTLLADGRAAVLSLQSLPPQHHCNDKGMMVIPCSDGDRNTTRGATTAKLHSARPPRHRTQCHYCGAARGVTSAMRHAVRPLRRGTRRGLCDAAPVATSATRRPSRPLRLGTRRDLCDVARGATTAKPHPA